MSSACSPERFRDSCHILEEREAGSSYAAAVLCQSVMPPMCVPWRRVRDGSREG